MAFEGLFPSAADSHSRLIFRSAVKHVGRMLCFRVDLYVFAIFGMQRPAQASDHADVDVVFYDSAASAKRFAGFRGFLVARFFSRLNRRSRRQRREYECYESA